METQISNSQKLLEIHRKSYESVVHGGILLDHFMSLELGLRLMKLFSRICRKENAILRLLKLVFHVEQKLYCFSHLRQDESLVTKLDCEYTDLREEMLNAIINQGTNKYHLILRESFSFDAYKENSPLLCDTIEELLGSDCKANQIRPVMNELEDIRKMLPLLEPFFEYKKGLEPCFGYENDLEPYFGYENDLEPFFEYKKDCTGLESSWDRILSAVVTVMEKVTCFVYSCAVGKMDDKMVLSLKNISPGLIIEETQIMNMYLTVDVVSTGTLDRHISMSLMLLGWNKRCYLGTELGEALEDHFIRIEHGLQYLLKIFNFSKNKDLKLRILHLIDNVKHKLYSLPHIQHNESMKVNLKHAFDELIEEMMNVVIKPGTNYYDTLIFRNHYSIPSRWPQTRRFILLIDIMISIFTKFILSSKANQIAPMENEILEFYMKLLSLEPLYRYVSTKPSDYAFVVIIHFLDRATCLIYLSMVAKLNEDMFNSLKKNFSSLIKETKIKKISLDLGIIFEDDFKSDIDTSLSLMKRHQEYHIYTINEAILEDHIISLKNGIEFLEWVSCIFYFDTDLKRCIVSFAQNVKQKLELLTFNQEDQSWNMDVNGAYAVMREEMKDGIIDQIADKYDSQFLELSFYDSPPHREIMKAYLERNNDFLVEKIATLVTSNCKDDRIAPLKKELQDLRKRLKIFKPLGLYICQMPRWRDEKQTLKTLLTFLQSALYLIYLTFVGTMDIEMVFLVKSSISISLKETDDIREIYSNILNQFLSEGHYKARELYLLENLMVLLENNGKSLNKENCELQKVLGDIHSVLLALPLNVIYRKLHLLKESFQDILRHSIPIVYSCYLEPTEVGISAEFKTVCNLIKHIKSEVQEMKLYYVPRVDDLGFLQFLLGYLEGLMQDQEILLKEIDDLHVEVSTLLFMAKLRTQDELDKNPWNDIMNLAYQAEYIIDLYLVSSPTDLELISTLSKIIQQLHNIRTDVGWGLSPLWRSLPAQDVPAETSKPQVRDNGEILGLREECKNIMEDLLKNENELNIVAITGMAGVGKTTLALVLYDSPEVARHFDVRAWCTVSQRYQLRSLLVSLLDQVNASGKSHISEDEVLADQFCKCLRKRRYLVILDDVWDTTLWKDLKRCLPDDRNGSRILITTRNREVVDQIGSKVNELHGLSDENSWELFQKKMLQIECLCDNLLTISKGIVKNCKGLPLSIVIVTGILSSIERTEEKWNQIAESVNSFVLPEPQGNCRAILELSYDHLPNHLRSCFLYLASFPADKEISVNRLILLWIGEGFIQDTDIDAAEEVGKRYVEDLIVKSLVIPVKKNSGGGVKSFRLHDLLRDFCLDIAKELHFFTLLGDEVLDDYKAFTVNNHSLALQDPRRIIINREYYASRNIVDFSCHSVRSMIAHGKLDVFEIKKRIGSFDMVVLRVLDVDEACSELLSIDHVWESQLEDISSLVHLRYLAFHSGPVFDRGSVFTSSISKLQNLQILILNLDRFKVADFIWDMVKLRHVHILEASFEVESNRLQNSSVLLENLKSLSRARVSYGDSKWLSKLLGLHRLHCLFTIDDLEMESDVEDNQSRMLSFNGTLLSLKVVNQTGRVQRLISTCQLPKTLQKLTLSYFCLESNDISIIGQTATHLEVFKIQRCSVPSGYEWNVDDADFPELKVLKLENLNIRKWTISEDSFPNLEQLWVKKCYCLDKIPLEFGSLLKLRSISVEYCPPSVDNSTRAIEKLQHEDQNTEMRVHIY